jgi:hypothetical protein
VELTTQTECDLRVRCQQFMNQLRTRVTHLLLSEFVAVRAQDKGEWCPG